jgi:hypothetical protein
VTTGEVAGPFGAAIWIIIISNNSSIVRRQHKLQEVFNRNKRCYEDHSGGRGHGGFPILSFRKNKGRYHYSKFAKKVDSNPERKLNFGFTMEKRKIFV